MPQTWNTRAFDYEMPPVLIHKVTHGTTWAKWCEKCEREIVIDLIRVLEHHEIYDDVRDERWRCKDCGGPLKGHNSFTIRALRFIGRWPREKTMVLPAREGAPSF